MVLSRLSMGNLGAEEALADADHMFDFHLDEKENETVQSKLRAVAEFQRDRPRANQYVNMLKTCSSDVGCGSFSVPGHRRLC